MDNLSDYVLIPVSAAVREKLELLVAPGDDTTIDALVELALAGDPAEWHKPVDERGAIAGRSAGPRIVQSDLDRK